MLSSDAYLLNFEVCEEESSISLHDMLADFRLDVSHDVIMAEELMMSIVE